MKKLWDGLFVIVYAILELIRRHPPNSRPGKSG